MALPEGPAAALPSAPLDPGRSRDIRREMLLMRAFQSRLAGPLLRRFADPQRILETGMAGGGGGGRGARPPPPGGSGGGGGGGGRRRRRPPPPVA
ncbi:hypothetical protein [Nocardia brasiliensis]|uniref:hypothetical protein n=1 Tax=Nocardia brasiliensis TaxID=37326 RepID=UPI002455D148|nr:hypothetical protein [Nocardia brasiliensis]